MLVLSGFISKILDRIEKTEVSIESWFISLFSIVFLRTFFEQFSNKVPLKFPLIEWSTLLHYSVFYICAVLFCILILVYVLGLNFKQSSILGLFFSLIITTPPILDLFVSFNQGYNMTYIFSSGRDVLISFLSFFYKGNNSGITFGIKTELFIICFSMFLFTLSYTKKIYKAIFSTFLIYIVIFILLALPSFLYIYSNQNPAYLIGKDILSSKIIENNLNPNYSSKIENLIDIGFNKLLGQIFTLMSLFAVFFLFKKTHFEILKEVFRNFRIERVIHYSLLVLFGLFFALSNTDFNSKISFFSNYINILSLFSLIIAFCLSWITAVCINDLEDVSVDTISNTDRPLVKGTLKKDDLKNIFKLSFVFSIILAYFVSQYSLFFIILFGGIYYIYSSEPLKLKRFFPINGILIGLACLTSFYSGFMLSSDFKYVSELPISFVIIFLVFFTLGSFIKDLKDIEGDKSENIKTMATILGEKSFKNIFSVGFVISMFIVSFLFKSPFLFFISIVLAIPAYKSIKTDSYKEKDFFKVYLTFLFFVVLRFVL